MLSLSIVIPTYNERDNIVVLLDQLENQLSSIKGAYEIIVVDDASPDDTAAIVEQHSQRYPDVRVIRRTAKRDLSAALALGFDSATGEYLLAIDADLQHDPAIIMQMLAEAIDVDLVVATRYAKQGNIARWHYARRFFSRAATVISASILHTTCSDPLSGYFLLRRNIWSMVRQQLHLAGFKLLLEILVVKPDIHFAEVGYCFVARQRGNSKFGFMVTRDFLLALWRVRRKQHIWKRSL
jgi:dolichol-phosphate mannosyltransferase